MKYRIYCLILLGFSSALFAGTGPTNTAATAGKTADPNVQPKPKKKVVKKSTPITLPRKSGGDIAAMMKQLQRQSAEIVRLWKKIEWLRRQLAGKASRAYVHTVTARMVNKAFAGTKGNPTRMPVAQSVGGVKLRNINVGRDMAKGDTVTAKGVPVIVRASGPKWSRSAKLYVYAVPVRDMVMRPQYLIHYDGEVPCLGGLMQTHTRWRGQRVKGAKMSAGSYKVLVRVVFYGYKKGWKRVGHALRYWGDGSPASYNLRLR